MGIAKYLVLGLLVQGLHCPLHWPPSPISEVAARVGSGSSPRAKQHFLVREVNLTGCRWKFLPWSSLK